MTGSYTQKWLVNLSKYFFYFQFICVPKCAVLQDTGMWWRWDCRLGTVMSG